MKLNFPANHIDLNFDCPSDDFSRFRDYMKAIKMDYQVDPSMNVYYPSYYCRILFDKSNEYVKSAIKLQFIDFVVRELP